MDAPSNYRVSLNKVAIVLFPALSALISWGTSSVLQDIGVANVALILAIVTTAGALIRWEAGILTSLVAASSLNFFHTEPIRSFRITSSTDLLMIFLLMSIGLGVSFITAHRVHQAVQHFHPENSSDLLKVTVQLLPETPQNFPIINRRLLITDDEDDLLLPETGAVMIFKDPRLQGVLLLTPHPGLGALYVSRRTMAAFADHVENILQ